ncbi:MAG: NAD(P)/FAD-dependent oxidoreductase [Methanobacteriota archaeon]
MENTINGAKIQNDGVTYAIQTTIPAGIVTPEDLERIARIGRKFSIPMIKMTSGQRFLLIGVQEKNIRSIREELGTLGSGMILPGVRYVQSCPGSTYCKNGTQDSLSLALSLSNRFQGRKFPAKLKIGVSGCPRCCGESKVRDIGIMGSQKGWTVYFGGNSGNRCRVGDMVASCLQTERVLELVDRLLVWFKSEAGEKETAARFMERMESEPKLQEEFSKIKSEFAAPTCDLE